MRTHQGEHPRLGATDVLPFVPVRGVTMDDCVRIAHEAGAVIAKELSIPVYFYERAARRPEGVNLEDVRRGALELLREQITTNPERAPDEGRPRVHESAGAIAVGARPFLIAFNVVLRSNDGTRQYAPPFKLSPPSFAVVREAPRHGEHTDELLREAGFDATAIDALVRERAVTRAS